MKKLWLLMVVASISSCDSEHLFHRVDVFKGEGSGDYKLGQRITIISDEPDPGFGFFSWVGDTAYVDEPRAPQTTLTVPLMDIRLEAVYKELPRYTLTVVDGNGSGMYLEGSRVLIEALAPDSNLLFTHWSGATQYLENPDTSVTYCTIPAENLSVEANWEAANLVSFSSTIQPLILTKCSTIGCHDVNSNNSILTTYPEIRDNASSIKDFIVSGLMPISEPLPQAEIDLFCLWIDQGKLNN